MTVCHTDELVVLLSPPLDAETNEVVNVVAPVPVAVEVPSLLPLPVAVDDVVLVGPTRDALLLGSRPVPGRDTLYPDRMLMISVMFQSSQADSVGARVVLGIVEVLFDQYGE